MKSLKFKRAAAFYLDLMLASFCVVPFGVLGMAYGMPTGESRIMEMKLFVAAVTVVGAVLMILRDAVFNGTSPAKRIFNLYVGNAEEPVQPVSRSKLIMRNLTLIILPIEVICFLITERRLGDRLAATEVYSKSSEC